MKWPHKLHPFLIGKFNNNNSGAFYTYILLMENKSYVVYVYTCSQQCKLTPFAPFASSIKRPMPLHRL